MKSVFVVAVLLCSIAQVPAQMSILPIPKTRMTFSYVVDVTGSMSSEINDVRDAIYNSTAHLEHFRSMSIDHFILTTFSDPKSLTRVYEYSNLHALHNKTASLKATGGGDCAEYGLDGLLKTINKSMNHSYIFYFSDAGVKDTSYVYTVYNAARKKDIKIWIIATGCCSGSCPTYYPYSKIANETKGLYYSITERDVPIVMKYVNYNVRCRRASGLLNPPKTFIEMKNWVTTHPGCVLPPPPVTLPPPVMASSSLTVHLFTVVMAMIGSILLA